MLAADRRDASFNRTGRLIGRLGPAERVELRWAGAGAGPEQKQGAMSVEGLILWDINPAGDRVRTRLIVSITASELSRCDSRTRQG